MGDTHVYTNHVDPLNIQLKREPRPFPTLRLDPSVKNIDDFRMDHLELIGYDPHDAIKMDMSV
jgi:thymidylate synthase